MKDILVDLKREVSSFENDAEYKEYEPKVICT
jgi:hypothetical protein